MFAAVAWLVIYRRFSFRLLSKSKGSPGTARVPPAPSFTHPRRAGRPRSQGRLFAATRIELRSVLGSIPFILLTLLWAALAAMQIVSDVAGGEYGAAFYPAWGLIFATLRQPLANSSAGSSLVLRCRTKRCDFSTSISTSP